MPRRTPLKKKKYVSDIFSPRGLKTEGQHPSFNNKNRMESIGSQINDEYLKLRWKFFAKTLTDDCNCPATKIEIFSFLLNKVFISAKFGHRMDELNKLSSQFIIDTNRKVEFGHVTPEFMIKVEKLQDNRIFFIEVSYQ